MNIGETNLEDLAALIPRTSVQRKIDITELLRAFADMKRGNCGIRIYARN